MIKAIPSLFKIITTWEEIYQLIKWVKETKICSFDFETDGNPYHDETSYPTCIGITFQVGSSYIIPLGHFDSPFKNEYIKILQLLGRELFMNKDIIKVAQNVKFEIKWLKKYGVEIHGRIFDTMLAHYLLDENEQHGLKVMVSSIIPGFAGYEDEVDVLKTKYGGWDKIPLEPLCRYNGLDCDLTLRLMYYFHPKLIKGGFYKLFRNLLMMATRVLAESEYHGMRVQKDYLEKLIVDYQIKIDKEEKALLKLPQIRKFIRRTRRDKVDEMIDEVRADIKRIKKAKLDNAPLLIKNREAKIMRFLGGEFSAKQKYEFNLGSHVHMKELFYTSDHGFKWPKQTKKNKKKETVLTTEEGAIDKLVEMKLDKGGFLKGLLALRGLEKLHSTYMVGIHKILDKNDRVHCDYHLLTVTGRLGCREPNMQNIPRPLTNPDVKPMFVPPRGFLHFEVDYSQAELRVVAELSKDKVMIDIFKRGYNIHVATACLANNALDRYDEVRKIIKDESHPENEFWERQKKKAKTINFGILYGQGDDKLADGMGVPVKEARDFRLKWIKTYPKVAKWIANQKVIAEENGYVYSIFGRKRRLPDIWSDVQWFRAEAERQAVNTPIQGAASDFTQLSTIVLRDMRLRGQLPNYFIQKATVHDSIEFYIKPKDVHWITPLTVKVCSNPDTMKWFGFEMKYVDMKASPELGINWGALKDYDDKLDYKTLIAA